MIGLALFVGIVIAVLAVGLGVGILISGRITGWMEREEEPDDR